MSLIVRPGNADDPYGSLIETFFSIEFPSLIGSSSSGVLDGVLDAIMATGQTRYGPRPKPESVVAIRDVIRKAISKNEPIPMLSPFGSRKSILGEPLDLAETFAMKQLACLQKRVSAVYSPGVWVNIRLEDASGHYLFADEGDASRAAAADYCASFISMTYLLGLDTFVKPVLESSIFTETELAAKADSILNVLIDYMKDSDLYGIQDAQKNGAWRTLEAMGWRGVIPVAQRDYYRNRYKTLYPDLSDHDATVKLARYFAQAWARVQLHGTGADPSWESDFIRLTFINPIPGLDASMTLKDVYYRTVPLRFTEYHMPPWRSKGYLQISEDGDVVPKIASWGADNDYHHSELSLEDENNQVMIRSDYVLK